MRVKVSMKQYTRLESMRNIIFNMDCGMNGIPSPYSVTIMSRLDSECCLIVPLDPRIYNAS